MKKLIKLLFSSLLILLLYYAIFSAISFSGLALVIEVEYLVLLGLAIAFSISSLTFISAKVDFAIGQNLAYLSILVPAFVYFNQLVDFLKYGIGFLVLFSVLFLIHYLFFNKELEDRFMKQIASLSIFSVLAILNTILHISFF